MAVLDDRPPRKLKPFSEIPPCPECGCEVVAVKHGAGTLEPGPDWGLAAVSAVSPPVYTLDPCGHEVKGFRRRKDVILGWRQR